MIKRHKRWTGCKLARKRKQARIIPTDSQEDNDRAQGKTAEMDCVLRSSKAVSLKKPTLAPSYLQTLWKGGTKTALTAHNKQNQASYQAS